MQIIKETINHATQIVHQAWTHFHDDSMFRNSFYIILSTGIISVSGFLFWFFAARLYSSAEVGIAGTIISACSFIVSIGSLGISNAFIRYIPPAKDKSEIINSGITLVTISTLIIAVVYLFLLPIFSPKLTIFTQQPFSILLFILLTVFAGVSSLIDSIFIAYRSAHFNMTTYGLFGTIKIIGVLSLIMLGTNGLLLAHTTGLLLSVFIGFYLMGKYLGINFGFNFNFNNIKKMFTFSSITYVTALIGGIPSFVLPIIILRSLDASSVAYFYMTMMIATLIFTIPNSITSSLFAEGSHSSEGIALHFKKATIFIALSLFLVNTAVVFFGRQMLSFLGSSYSSQGYMSLVLLSLSSIFLAINSIFSTALKIQRRLNGYLIINFFGALIIILVSYLNVKRGLTYVSLGWLVGQIFMSVCFFGDYLFAGKNSEKQPPKVIKKRVVRLLN